MIRQLLIVTDHTTHAVTNSLYELAIALAEENVSNNVWVCSRGIEENKDFFAAISDAPIYATLIKKDFAFHIEGLYFHQSFRKMERQEIDAILIRMPQPLDKLFLKSLEAIVPAEKIINSPLGTIETSSKAFLLEVAALCPAVSLCMNITDAIALSEKEEIVLKPLYTYGGRGIIRLSKENYWEGDKKFPLAKISTLLSENQFPMLAMKYLKNVSLGDKRTIVVNGKILGSALRLPGPDSWICNIANGGHAEFAHADKEELKIESELTPLLYKKGVIMYGFDTLVNDDGRRVLSEINTLSIGGLGPLVELSGRPVIKEAATLIWEYLNCES